MISLRDKIVNEGVLNSTKSGVEGVRKHVEEWIAENNIKKAIINPDCSITIGSSRLGENVIKGNIPDYIVINDAQNLTITECTSLKNFPKRVWVLMINNSTFDDFSELDVEECTSLRVSNCNFKSIKGLPKDCQTIFLGNNNNHFTKKDIKKIVNTKPQDIHTLGYYSTSWGGGWVLGTNDVEYCRKELDELEKRYNKAIPQTK